MLGSIKSRPWDDVKVVPSAPFWTAPCSAPAAPASDCISTTSGTEPQRLRRPAAVQSSACSPMVEAGVIGSIEITSLQACATLAAASLPSTHAQVTSVATSATSSSGDTRNAQKCLKLSKLDYLALPVEPYGALSMRPRAQSPVNVIARTPRGSSVLWEVWPGRHLLASCCYDQGSGHGVIFRVGSGVVFDLVSQDEVGAGVAGVGGSQVLTEFSDGGGGSPGW